MVNYEKLIGELKNNNIPQPDPLLWQRIESTINSDKHPVVHYLERLFARHRYIYSSCAAVAVGVLLLISIQTYKSFSLERYINQYSLALTNTSVYQTKYDILSSY